MKVLFFLLKRSRSIAMLALIAGIISGVSNTGLLAVINGALRGNETSNSTLALAFVGLCLFLPLARYTSEILLSRLGQGTLFDLRMNLSSQILGVPLRQLEQLGAPRLLASLTEDIPVVTNAMLIIPNICMNGAVVIVGLIYLGWLSGPVLLAVLAFLVIGIATYQLPVLRAVRYLRAARQDADKLLDHFRSLTGGTKELKLHRRRREAFLGKVLQPTALSMQQNHLKGVSIYTAAASWGQILVFVVIGLIIFVLPKIHPVDLATLTGYTLVLLHLMTPLQLIMNSMPTLSRANVAVRKVEELGLSLSKIPKEKDSSQDVNTTADWGRIELTGIMYGYQCEGEETSFMLGPLDLTIHPNELVFFTGGNGSGKTTLAKLLVGLYSPESGHIHVNGLPVTDETRDDYREHFSVVFSDFHLFTSLLGLESPELDDRARAYLSEFRLEHKLQVKDGVLSTTDLSQGQRKRLALLTAYLEDRPIYLFDEWAADQDPHFKEIFYYQLLPELKARGKTVIVISHDDHYYKVADRIIKLDYGKIEYDSTAAPLGTVAD